MVEVRTIYKSFDGCTFDSYADAESYENKLKVNRELEKKKESLRNLVWDESHSENDEYQTELFVGLVVKYYSQIKKIMEN